MKKLFPQTRGVTLVELLVVVAIIGMFTSIALVSMTQVRGKARDVARVEHVQQVQKALEFYWLTYQRYPDPDNDGCGGWDVGNAVNPFISGKGMEAYFANGPLPVDTYYNDDCNGFRYYRYPPGSYGCPPGRGSFYVLGITDTESSGTPYLGSPGWSCPGRDFQEEFDWVTGSYER
jgi:prepilin-type N-terminal cleavage/methylation domain-containing protein